MEGLLIFFVIMIISSVIGSASKKKQKEAIAEQRRRRQEYESRQQRQTNPTEVQMQDYGQEEQIPDIRDLFGELFGSPASHQSSPRRMSQPPKTRPPVSVIRKELSQPQTVIKKQPEMKPVVEHIESPLMERRQQNITTPLFADRDALVQGIIMAEVLGEPRCRHHRIRV